MSYEENYKKLKRSIYIDSVSNNVKYNDFVRSFGDLNQFLSFNPQINHEESLVLDKALRCIGYANELITGLRTENYNRSVESKGMEETAYDIYTLKNEEVDKEKKPRNDGKEKTVRKAELWQDYINTFVNEYIQNHPYQFNNGCCKNFRELENFVETKLLNVRDDKLRNSTGKNKGLLTPPVPNKTKLTKAIKLYLI